MRRTASEILRQLDSRIAKLEKQSTVNTISNETMGMIEKIALHKRGDKYLSINFNILQEALETIGFVYESKNKRRKHESNYDNSKYKLEELVKVLSSIHPNFEGFPEDIRISTFDGTTPNKLFNHIKSEINSISDCTTYEGTAPKKAPFGEISFGDFTQVNWTSSSGGPLLNIQYDLYLNGKNYTISLGKLKTSEFILKNIDMDNFDATKILSFVINKCKGNILAKNYLDSLNPVEISEIKEEKEPQLTLLEQGKGTCQFCGQIGSITKSQTLYKHGHEFSYSSMFRDKAPCPGSFHKAYELSNEGLKEIKKRLKMAIKRLDREDKDYKRNLARYKESIALCDRRIKNWKPQV